MIAELAGCGRLLNLLRLSISSNKQTTYAGRLERLPVGGGNGHGALLLASNGVTAEGDNASLLVAGQLLLMTTTGSELIVARANSARFEEVKRYTIAESAVWAHPAVTGRAIVVKDVDKLICWAI